VSHAGQAAVKKGKGEASKTSELKGSRRLERSIKNARARTKTTTARATTEYLYGRPSASIMLKRWRDRGIRGVRRSLTRVPRMASRS